MEFQFTLVEKLKKEITKIELQSIITSKCQCSVRHNITTVRVCAS